MRYFGGKNLDGVYQRIINQIPPHDLYIEPFCGSAAILRHKRPAERSIAIDLDPGALDGIRDAVPPGTELVNGDGLRYLAQLFRRFRLGRAEAMASETFVYCDPPYVPETRRSGKRYRHEMTVTDHKVLLTMLIELPCLVMLSGYRSTLYDRRLRDWRRIEFPAITRGNWSATEVLWMNYPEPVALHDYRYLGRDFREREKLVASSGDGSPGSGGWTGSSGKPSWRRSLPPTRSRAPGSAPTRRLPASPRAAIAAAAMRARSTSPARPAIGDRASPAVAMGSGSAETTGNGDDLRREP